MKIVTLVADYDVNDGDITITIVIGDAQIGSSVVALGTKVLGKGQISTLPVGKGSLVRGKPLFAKSVVTDVNDSTNQTSVTYILRGGPKDQEFQSGGVVEVNGDSVIYRAKFNLV
jgi:hypothetical protein